MKINFKTIVVVGLVLAAALFVSGCLSTDKDSDFDNVGMMSFKSEKELKDYLNNISTPTSRSSPSYGANDAAPMMAESSSTMPVPESPATGSSYGGGGDYSGTNVQIAGVDEADFVKTDGKIIYYTPSLYYTKNVTYHANEKYPYYTYDTYQITYVINALPAATSSIISEIVETGGSLYLFNDTLIIIKNNWNDSNIVAYDVSDPESPVKSWEQSYDDYYLDSRMIDGKLYLITQQYGIGVYPMIYMGRQIPAADIYYSYGPGIILPATDITYFVSRVDIETGSFEKTIALFGSYNTVLFASGDNLYLTNHYYPNTQKMYMDFVLSNGSNYFPPSVMSHIKKVMGYDLSDYVKYIAVSEDINNYYVSLDDDESVEVQKFYSDYNDYTADLIEKTEKTTITKISMETFDVVSGVVPGRINGRFSMDENDGNLRVVSSKGYSWYWWSDKTQSSSVVTVFDSNMKGIGTLEGLALGEDVQGTRYIGNTLYITTYSDADPFLVIDLSDPENPRELGSMKLTGSYSYLYPINDTLIVGFGTSADWRDWRSKLSLYDVSDPTKPVELDTFYFAPYEYASIYDYHGFTWNAGRNLMVVPGYNHAYIFEIKDGKISLIKDDHHEKGYVVRSVYIGNNLYIISDKEIHVYDMNNWQRVRTISIPQPVYPDYGLIYPVSKSESPSPTTA